MPIPGVVYARGGLLNARQLATAREHYTDGLHHFAGGFRNRRINPEIVAWNITADGENLFNAFDGCQCRRHRKYRVEFLIATLPEPFSPGLRASFDNELDAITAAANDAGYTLDSFDLPWQDAAKNQPEGLKLAPEIEVLAENPPSIVASSASSPIRSRKLKAKRSASARTVTPQSTPNATASPTPCHYFH